MHNKFCAFVASVSMFICLVLPAQAQIWLSDVHVNTNVTQGTNTVTVRPGDTVVVEGSLNEDDGVFPTTMRVWTASGYSMDLRQGHASDRVSFITPYTTDAAYGHFGNHDADDVGYIRIGIMPRANLTALTPVLRWDGGIDYGYRVGDKSWHPNSHYVTVELFFVQGNNIIGPKIAEHTLLTSANATGWFNVPASQIPPVPARADGVMAIVDRQDVIPESDEGDNQAVTPLPNLRVVAPSYDVSGDITYGYQIQHAYVNTNQYITLALFYATGPNVSDIIPNLPPIHETTLDLNMGPEHLFRLTHGEYPLPMAQARCLVAVIDPYHKIRQAAPGVADDEASTPCQVAPGYVQIASNKGVGVYARTTANATFYATVVDLRDATIGQLGDPYNFSRLGVWWDQAKTYDTPDRELIAMINGTYFDYDWTDKLPTTTQGFSYGLKINGAIFDYGTHTFDPSNKPVLFTYDNQSGTAAILPYRQSVMDDIRYPNLIGAIAGTRQILPAGTTRQWAGVRDRVGSGLYSEANYRTVIFLTIPNAVSFATAENEMKAFLGRNTNPQWAQLDGGSSTTLLVNRHTLSSPITGRLLPHIVTIYAGK